MSKGLRLSGGAWRGRRLEVASGVRPTEGRVREALLSIWQDHLAGARILDLFAGSGAVALEALSRGADEAVLVDRSSESLGALKRNCRLLQADRARVQRLDLPRGLSRLRGPFDLIFADPPYAFRAYDELVTGALDLLDPQGQMVVEHEAELQITAMPSATRRYGGTLLSFFDPPRSSP